MKILTVIGARPQFIKAAMLSRAFGEAGAVEEVIVHTGQHYDHSMSDIFFDQLGIPAPGYTLDIAGGGHGDMTGRMLCALEPVMKKESPDMILVYGDTNSTIAGALTASKLHLPIAHVEAGLRSYNRRMPEEVNRVLTDHLATWLFCPSESAVTNLKSEGISQGVHLVGDIMFDAALHFGRAAKNAMKNELLERLPDHRYILATVHRQENTDDKRKLTSIITSLATMSEVTPVVLPLHPRTRTRLEEMGLSGQLKADQLHVVDPYGYFEMLAFEQRAGLIVTDSGGIQKEAYFFKVPCLTLRDETEWTELVELGWNRLVNVLEDDIVEMAQAAIGTCGDDSTSPYGTGNTASQIVDTLISWQGV